MTFAEKEGIKKYSAFAKSCVSGKGVEAVCKRHIYMGFPLIQMLICFILALTNNRSSLWSSSSLEGGSFGRIVELG